MRTIQNEKEESLNPKKEYLPPKIEVSFVEMENGIAANSATVIPPNTNNEVSETWEAGDDIDGGNFGF